MAADRWGLSWKGTTGYWLSSWASSGTVPVVTPTQTPAGRPRRRRFFVEIDGQIFLAENESHAQAILDRAAELAEKAAQAQADEIVTKRLSKSRIRTVAPVKIATPKIVASAQIDLQPYQKRIEQAYAEAERLAEIRLMMERQAAMDEEEEALLLLL
jgi:hypothetical protein